MKKLHIAFSIFIALLFTCLHAHSTPIIGAQVIIEPGQTSDEIDVWFRRMHENGLRVCRIRMFEDYMRQPDGTWDYTLFDIAFKCAEKYDVRIFATLFPSAPDNSLGGFKFPLSKDHEQQIAIYIKNVVNHFKNFNSFYGWVLINEPGNGEVPNNEYAREKFKDWKAKQIEPEYNSRGYNTSIVNFDNEKFLVDYNTWYLDWLAKEVAKYDTKHEIHVNNHQIFENIAEYDFPSWRKLLTSLGASAHPSWHFGYFNRNQYTLAMAANCNIIRSGAGYLPFWVTELQGGNNTYSGVKAFCPTAQEVTQWLWTSIGVGAKGIIYWCLNPRSIGEEAGEWALLDFQNEASDRLNATSKVANCLKENKDCFNHAEPLKSPVSIIYTRESLWVEKKIKYGINTDLDYEGRLPGGVMKSALAFYEIISENGLSPNLQEINEYDWTKNNYKGEVIILAHQISIPSKHWNNIRHFVNNGGKLILEGLSAFFDENMLSLHNTGFPLEDICGGALKEVKCIPGDFEANIVKPINTHLWQGSIHSQSALVLSEDNGQVTATRKQYGKGEVIWMPSLVGLGAWRSHNKDALSGILREELLSASNSFPFYFDSHYNGVSMQTLKTDNKYVTIIASTNMQPVNLNLLLTQHKNSKCLFSNDDRNVVADHKITIYPYATIVIEWK